MGLLQLQPPSAFSISADPHTVSKRWTEWATTLKRFLAASGISDDAQKQEILLYTAGKEVADIFKEISESRPATDQPEQQTLDSLIAALTQHFQGRDNVVFTRYRFRQCAQLDGEAIDSWYNQLCNAAEAYQFGELRQSLIRDQIVACCRSESLRKRLLNVPNISLPEALQLARTNEAASQQAAIMERSAAGPAEEVHAARGKRSTRRPPASPADKCLRCGEPGHRTCNRAQGKRCSNCGKLHYLAKAYLSGRARINMAEPEPEEPAVAHLEEAAFSSLDPSRKSATFKAVINGSNVPILIDSGASCNDLYSRSSEALDTAGQITLHTKINGNSGSVLHRHQRRLHHNSRSRNKHADGDAEVGPPAETALTPGLTPTVNDQHLPQDLRLSSIMKEFSDRFQEIGCIKGVSVSIQLKEEAVPVCHPPSRVPVHLRTAVEKELKDQLAAGILERVTGPSAWSSRMLCSVGMMTREGYEVHVLGKRHQERMLPPDKRPGAVSAASGSTEEPELVKSDFVFLHRIACQLRELLDPLGSRVLNYAELPGNCCVALFDQLDSSQWDDTYRHLSARSTACPVYIQNGVCGSRQPVDKRRLNFVFLYNLPDNLTPADVSDGAAGGRIPVDDVRIVERLGDARAAFVRVPTNPADRTEIINRLSSSSDGFSVFELWAPAESLQSPSSTPPPAPLQQHLQAQPAQPMMIFNQVAQAHYPHPLVTFQQAQYSHPAQYMQYPANRGVSLTTSLNRRAAWSTAALADPAPVAIRGVTDAIGPMIDQRPRVTNLDIDATRNRGDPDMTTGDLGLGKAILVIAIAAGLAPKVHHRDIANAPARLTDQNHRIVALCGGESAGHLRVARTQLPRLSNGRQSNRTVQQAPQPSCSLTGKGKLTSSSLLLEAAIVFLLPPLPFQYHQIDCYASCYAVVHPSTGSKAVVVAPLPGKSLSKSRLMDVAQFLARSAAKKLKLYLNDEKSLTADEFLDDEFEVVWEKELPIIKDSDATDSDSGGMPDADAEFRVESEAESTESNGLGDVSTSQSAMSDVNSKPVEEAKAEINPVESAVESMETTSAESNSAAETKTIELNAIAVESADEATVRDAEAADHSIEVSCVENLKAEANALIAADQNAELADSMETVEEAVSTANPSMSADNVVDAPGRDVTTDPIGALFETVIDEKTSASNVFDEANFSENVSVTDAKPSVVNHSLVISNEAGASKKPEASNPVDQITESVEKPDRNKTEKVESNSDGQTVESMQLGTIDVAATDKAIEGVEGKIETTSETPSDTNESASVDIIVREVAEALLDTVVRTVESGSTNKPHNPSVEAAIEAEKLPASATTQAETSAQPTDKSAHDSVVGSLCLREYSTVTCHEFASSLPDRFLFWPTRQQAPFLLIWNLPTQLPLSQLIGSLREMIPRLRSVHVPRDPLQPELNCGYCVIRFQCDAEDAFGRCLGARDKVRTFARENRQLRGNKAWQTKLRAIPAQMREICHVPPFSFPCHNLISWVASVEPSTERCVIDRSPFACPCHPVCEELAPDSQKFVQFAELVQQARAAYPVDTVRANLRSYLDSADESDSTQAQPAPTVDSNSNSSSDSEQLLLLSDFVLLPPDIPDAKSSKAVASDANHRQYVRYSASLGDRTVLLFDAVPTDQWPAVLHQLGPGACPLYFSIGDNQQQPAEALSDVSLMLAEWNDPDAMRLGEDCWPADQLVDFAPLPAPTQLTDAPADAMSDEAAVEAPATALALLKPGTDRAKLTSRLANAGARTHNLWPVPVSAALRLDSRLNGQRRRRPIDDNIGDANDEAFAPEPVGEAESESKRPRLSIDANQPLWQVQPGKAYLRITGLRRSADPVQLTDLTMHQLAGLALTGYSFYPPGPADCGKAVQCTFKPDVPASSIESAADDLVRMFQRQGLQDSERRPVTASVVLPDSVGVSTNLEPAQRSKRQFNSAQNAPIPAYGAQLLLSPASPASSGQLRNCGFAVARFNRPADCAHAMERMRSATQQQLMAIFCSGLIRVSYAALLETCHVPPMFTFPCHNLLPWLINANQNSENPLDFLLDSPPYSPAPFTCPCHPDAMPSAPAGGMFDWLAFTLRMRLPADGDPIQTV
uniref:CCHC-type domain-containing protein n=1 Tax=Macrostomum lignano TaxID=282301 RepID=A0A1I8I8L7_9PLAT